MPRRGSAGSCGAGAALTGPVLATYTGVLMADTAVPAWHEGYRHLPLLFAGSALASAGAVGMAAVPRGQAGSARRMALLGAGLELAAAGTLEKGAGMREQAELVSEPYRTGRAGALLRLGRGLTAAGAAGAFAMRPQPYRRGGVRARPHRGRAVHEVRRLLRRARLGGGPQVHRRAPAGAPRYWRLRQST